MDSEDDQAIPKEVVEEIVILYTTVFESKGRPGQILRLHALTEWYIERLLGILLKKPDVIINNQRFSYSHKLKIVQSLNGLPERIIDALRRLSKLRNECAHSMYPVISDEAILEASQPITKEFKLTLQDHKNDRMEKDIFHAYVWALFSELSLAVTPFKIVYDEITGKNA